MNDNIHKAMTWDQVKNTLCIGDHVQGVVTKHWPFGVFIDIGCAYDGLVEIMRFKDHGIMTPAEYPAIGETVRAVVLWFRDQSQQIALSMQPSKLNKD